jgi:hypothetical protein
VLADTQVNRRPGLSVCLRDARLFIGAQLGAGIFFISYLALQIPGALLG